MDPRNEQMKTRFYAEPEDKGDAPVWVIAGAALLVVFAVILVLGGGIYGAAKLLGAW